MKIFLVLISCTIFTTARTFTDEDLWKMHSKRVKSFTCGPPQPRIYSVGDILPPEVLSAGLTTFIKPEVTVLHRCDQSSGCCTGQKQCSPKKTQEVDLVFRRVSGTESEYIHTTVVNHTLCSCKSLKDLPK